MASHPSNGKRFCGAVEVGDVLVHLDVLSEMFACDIARCHGVCCEEGDAGAPVSLEEIAQIEEELDCIWPQLSAQAQAVIDRQGVAYTDSEGDLVTSIVAGRNCVFRGPSGCLLSTRPISCHLYPIREKQIGELTVLNYHRWDICRCAVQKGRAQGLRVYKFLKEPLIRRFGKAWYEELELVAHQLLEQGYLSS